MKYEIVDFDTVILYDSKGRDFLISLSDISLVEKYTWYVSREGYVERKSWNGGKNTTHRLHRDIMNKFKMVDHINGDKSDNRRINLRECNHASNSWNTGLPSNNKTGYKGVIERKDYKFKTPRYRAYITVNHKRICLGTFYDIDSAGKARIEAEKKYFNEYRREY